MGATIIMSEINDYPVATPSTHISQNLALEISRMRSYSGETVILTSSFIRNLYLTT